MGSGNFDNLPCGKCFKRIPLEPLGYMEAIKGCPDCLRGAFAKHLLSMGVSMSLWGLPWMEEM